MNEWKAALERVGVHKALYSGSLSAVDFPPTAGLWVLEIQIRHPERPIGAFYEDLLLDQRAGS